MMADKMYRIKIIKYGPSEKIQQLPFPSEFYIGKPAPVATKCHGLILR